VLGRCLGPCVGSRLLDQFEAITAQCLTIDFLDVPVLAEPILEVSQVEFHGIQSPDADLASVRVRFLLIEKQLNVVLDAVLLWCRLPLLNFEAVPPDLAGDALRTSIQVVLIRIDTDSDCGQFLRGCGDCHGRHRERFTQFITTKHGLQFLAELRH
jgi:hypothetical protein